MFGKKEMQRTCKRDGTVWYCSVKESRMRKPNAMLRLGANLSAAGDGVSAFGSGKGQLQQMNIRNQMDRVSQISTCPSCGSSKFKEKIVKA